MAVEMIIDQWNPSKRLFDAKIQNGLK